jgi:hypothetical protein
MRRKFDVVLFWALDRFIFLATFRHRRDDIHVISTVRPRKR